MALAAGLVVPSFLREFVLITSYIFDDILVVNRNDLFWF